MGLPAVTMKFFADGSTGIVSGYGKPTSGNCVVVV
jgi:hypothetical protein